ncbi:MAG: restriction endonuclease subunit S [Parafannyhessea umbonata]|uniref:restriction endonuclease subunit S n=1 Tax=Parafannyhessea umbonata TaxID=604330 RepID=UPI0026EEB343|nr:restriction endonuclease subunit S [Parafannyhessea umbonata]MDD6566216.1 restriction endonuclease subunit S [Parafannyhessea umbonata]
MTSKPPFGGEAVRLNQLCSKGKSNLRQKDIENDGPFNVYGASGIVGRMDTYQNERPYVAIVKDGAGVGRAILCEGKTSVLGTMQALLPNEGTNLSYLLHLVRSLKLGENYSGSTIPHIYFKDYGRQEVPALSAGQQSAIAERLDLAEQLVALIDDETAKLDSLVKSRFVEMFGDPVSNTMDWEISTIKETAVTYGDGPFGSNLKSSDYVDEGVRVIRLGNILTGSFSERDRSFVSFEKYERLKKYECKPGEVVIGTLGDPLLRACIVPDFGVPSIHKADCMYYETDKSKVLPVFAMSVINQPTMLKRAMLDMHGQTRARINSTQVGNLPMMLPPLALQQEFADFVNRVDKLRVEAQTQKEKLQTLYDSLAQDYFAI